MWDARVNTVLYRAGLSVVARAAQALRLRGQLILSLHSVAPHRPADGDAGGGLSITDRFLERIIADCARRAIPIVSLAEALRRHAAQDSRPFLVLTFDDGYRDLYANAFPVLERHAVPFTIFVTTGLIDRVAPMWWHALERAVARAAILRFDGGTMPTATRREKGRAFAAVAARFRAAPPDAQRRLVADLERDNARFSLRDAYDSSLDWDMLRTMHRSGLAEIGCHSVHHPMFSTLDPERIRAEIAVSRDRIASMLDLAPRYFAYPFGQDHEVGPHAPSIVRSCGFAAGFTTNQALLSSHRPDEIYSVPRLVLAKKGEDLLVLQAYMSGLPQKLRSVLAS